METRRKINLLYVDDEPINLELFKLTFQKIFHITTAESGKVGLELLEKNDQFDVVISDMKMPFMNGIEFIKQAQKIYSQISFLILTGFDINEDIENALKSGLIKGYFRKPIIREEIIKGVFESFQAK